MTEEGTRQRYRNVPWVLATAGSSALLYARGLGNTVCGIPGQFFDGRGWQEIMAQRSAQQAAELAAAKEEAKTPAPPTPAEKVEPSPTLVSAPQQPTPVPEKVHFAAPHPVHVEEEKVLGIPKDLLLPASIGALAAVILGVFTISRITR